MSYSDEHNSVIIEAIADVTPLHADELRSVARRVRLMAHELEMARANLNVCRCGNRPELVTQQNGLVRISCVLAKCNEIVCARSGMAQRAWNEINPDVDEEKTEPLNPIPLVSKSRPSIAAEPVRDAFGGTGRYCVFPPADDEVPTDPTGGVR